jgi:hypothetical protein
MRQLFYRVFAVALLAGLVLLGWIFVQTLLASSPSVQAGIISFISAVGVALYTHSRTQKREIEARHFAEKRAVYLHFIGFIFSYFEAQREDRVVTEDELIKEMSKFQQNLLVWGSPEVITAYNNFGTASEQLAGDQNQETSSVLVVVDELYRAMRKDLGHNDSSLIKGELVGLMLNAEGKAQLRKSMPSGQS